jgi:hypothetical protein
LLTRDERLAASPGHQARIELSAGAIIGPAAPSPICGQQIGQMRA